MSRTGIIIEGTEIKKSIVRDSAGLIVSGLAIGENDSQNVQFNIEMMPGDSKEYLTVGCGIYEYIKGFIDLKFYRRAGISLEADKYNIKDVEFVTQ